MACVALWGAQGWAAGAVGAGFGLWAGVGFGHGCDDGYAAYGACGFAF